jgi:hypothetical protein
VTEDKEPLSPADIHWRASCVADGSAPPESARELIAEFVRQSRSGRIEPRLIEHVSDCFAVFLAGERKLIPSLQAGINCAKPVSIKTLEKAFGLTRVTRGQPAIDEDTQCAVAMEVLDRMLLGDTLEVASEFVARDRWAASLQISSETQVRGAWAKHKMDGLLWLRIYRTSDVSPDGPPWSAAELTRLAEIFKDEPWYVPPGVDAKKHMDALVAQLDNQTPDSTPENSANKKA